MQPYLRDKCRKLNETVFGSENDSRPFSLFFVNYLGIEECKRVCTHYFFFLLVKSTLVFSFTDTYLYLLKLVYFQVLLVYAFIVDEQLYHYQLFSLFPGSKISG